MQLSFNGFEDAEIISSKPVNIKHEAAKFLIKKFLKEKPKSYAAEIKMANKVLAVHPEVCNIELGFKLNSLAWLLTDDGKKAVNSYLFSKKLEEKQPETQLSKEKFGEDKIIPKQKTMKDFLS